MSIAWSHILLQFKQSLFIYFWSVSYLRGKFFRIKRLGLTTAIFTEGNDWCTGSWWNNEKDVWPEETGNSFIARWLVDAWSDMQKFFCAARSPLSIHPSRFLRIGPKTLDFSPFLCVSSGSWRKYSFLVLASLERLLD